MEYKAWKRAYKKHLNTAFICLICFGQVIPCSIITGCSKNFEGTKKEETSKKIPAANEKISPGGSSGSSTATLVPTTALTLLPTRAATTIQAAGRKYNAENQLAVAKKAATTIQAAGRKYNAENQLAVAKKAATTIQAAGRKYNAENQLAVAKKAATTIQAAGRKYNAENQFAVAKKAATTIQAAGRKYNAENQFAVAKEAATTIQVAYRKHVARKEFVENKPATIGKTDQKLEQSQKRPASGKGSKNPKALIAPAPTTNDRGKKPKTSNSKESPPDNLSQSWIMDSTEDIDNPQSGREYLQRIWENSQKLTIEKEMEQEVVANIMNYLFDKAKNKKQSFEEGTYMIEDHDSHFFKFLQGLARSYERISSHKIGENMSQHYGFDILEGAFKPTNKRHILFFSTEQNGAKKLFLKPENYGTKEWGDFINHSAEYLESLAKRRSVIKSDNTTQEGHRKERVKYLPPKIQTACQKCIALIGDSHLETDDTSLASSGYLIAETQETANKKFQEDGIAFLIERLKTNRVKQSDELRDCLKSLEEALQQHNLDYADKRMAQEVIFTQEELIGL